MRPKGRPAEPHPLQFQEVSPGTRAALGSLDGLGRVEDLGRSRVMMKRVAVLMGGWGEEREVSLATGAAIVRGLTARGHAVTEVLAEPGFTMPGRGEVDAAFLALHGRMGEDGKIQGLLEV